MTTQVEAVLFSNETTEPEYWVICEQLPMEYTEDEFVRIVEFKKIRERVKGDTYATWNVFCERDGYGKDETIIHPFIVWTLVARPEGWSFANGEYYSTYEEALKSYRARL
jgi:hypothetical protein